MKKENIDKVIEDLKRYPEVIAIILYGSYAKGKEKPLSDIDIAVILKDKSLEAEISSFSSNILDVVPFHRLPLYIQFEVLKYGKILFSRDKKDFMDVKRKTLKDYLEMSYLYNRMSRRILTR
ncbi:MAG: nucleotidyltransferase domain-containing protein [Thermoplasmata archaeon]|nr:MAG: nucleotidyltransferase domain-containing protein [Thermoplasmata archaeon]